MTSTLTSVWNSKRQGTLNQFFTRTRVTDILIDEIGSLDVGDAIDLGAGDGSLAVGVARRWPSVRLSTVDIDASCADNLKETISVKSSVFHTHHIADALSFNLPDLFPNKKFDLAVCNPPFFRPKWSRDFAKILQASDFSDACKTTSDASAEILFFAQLLRLIREGGIIALILPNGLVTSWRNISFRRALLTQHTVISVIQLPPNSFHDTDACCFVLIIRKGKAPVKSHILIKRIEDGGFISTPIEIDQEAAIVRLDWSFHSATQNIAGIRTTLRELGADIRRGSLNSAERRTAAFPVFHTSEFPAPGVGVAFDASGQTDYGAKILLAEPGDILIARVDRDIHNKISFVVSGHSPITDCVFRVRLPEPNRAKVFNALSSPECRGLIKSLTKGVGARLLSKIDLLDLPISIEN